MVAPAESLSFPRYDAAGFEKPRLTVVEPVPQGAAMPENIIFLADRKKPQPPMHDTKPVLIYGIGSLETINAVSGFGSEKDREEVLSIEAKAWEQVFADDAAREKHLEQKNLQQAAYPYTEAAKNGI